jgi:hypothetical protein
MTRQDKRIEEIWIGEILWLQAWEPASVRPATDSDL